MRREARKTLILRFVNRDHDIASERSATLKLRVIVKAIFPVMTHALRRGMS